MTPAPVSGEGYSMGFTSETRSNYLRGGLVFSTAYDSDVTTGTQRPAGKRRELFDMAHHLAGPDQITTALGFHLQPRVIPSTRRRVRSIKPTKIWAWISSIV